MLLSTVCRLRFISEKLFEILVKTIKIFEKTKRIGELEEECRKMSEVLAKMEPKIEPTSSNGKDKNVQENAKNFHSIISLIQNNDS